MIDDPIAALIERKLVEYTRRLGRTPDLDKLAKVTGLAPGRLRSELRQILVSLKSRNQTLERHGLVVAINTILEACPVDLGRNVQDGQVADLSRFKTNKEEARAETMNETELNETLANDDSIGIVELLSSDLREVMSNLSPRERDLLRLRFGLDDGRQRTLEEIASLYGVARERIKQMEAAALRKLRSPRPPRRPR